MLNTTRMTVTCLILILTLVTGADARQASSFAELDTLVRQLRAEIDLLRSDMKRLQNTVETLQQQAVPVADDDAPAALAVVAEVEDIEDIMYLEGLSFTRGVEERAREIDSLRSEARSLRERARDSREEANRLKKYPWWGHWAHSYPPAWWSERAHRERRRAVELQVSRAQRALRNEALDYDREAQQREGAAKRLERQAAESVCLLLHGWNGRNAVMLEASRDFRALLDGKTCCCFVTWRGLPTGHDPEVGETWEITSIDVVPAPPDFTMRASEEGEEDEET